MPSSERSSITIGTTWYPSTSGGIASMTAATFSASLWAGETTTIRFPEGRSAAASQSNADCPNDSTSCRIPRSLVSTSDCIRISRTNRTPTANNSTAVRRCPLPGSKLKTSNSGLNSPGAIASRRSTAEISDEMIRLNRLIRRRW